MEENTNDCYAEKMWNTVKKTTKSAMKKWNEQEESLVEQETMKVILAGILLATFLRMTVGTRLKQPKTEHLDAKSFFNQARNWTNNDNT